MLAPTQCPMNVETLQQYWVHIWNLQQNVSGYLDCDGTLHKSPTRIFDRLTGTKRELTKTVKLCRDRGWNVELEPVVVRVGDRFHN